MTIATGFLAQSAQIGGLTLSGLTTIGLSQGGSPVDLRSDGELYPRVTPIIPTPIEVDLETRDISPTTADTGLSGAMSIVAAKMTGGKTLSGSVTFTAASSTIISVSRGTDINGAALTRITARINSPDGLVSGLTVTVV